MEWFIIELQFNSHFSDLLIDKLYSTPTILLVVTSSPFYYFFLFLNKMFFNVSVVEIRRVGWEGTTDTL